MMVSAWLQHRQPAARLSLPARQPGDGSPKITVFVFHFTSPSVASKRPQASRVSKSFVSKSFVSKSIVIHLRPPMSAYRWSTAAMLAVVLAAASTAAAAQAGPPLRIGHYSTGNGLIGFVLDRLGTPIKLRFDGSDEILALTPEPAPFDAVQLKRDDGRSVLRLYPDGQVLVFSDKIRSGSDSAQRDQDAQALSVRAATKAQAQADAAALGQKLKQVGGVTLAVALEAPGLADQSEGWASMADAVSITEAGLVEMLTSPIRATPSARNSRVSSSATAAA
jgi:hypothetical protein